MAQSSVMREFLVALGFKVDAAGESKFKNAADGANKSISELGKSLSAASIGVATLLTVSAAKLDSLAVASQRTGASVGNIKAFQYAVEQLGGTADGALQSIDGLRQKMRESPGYESALKSLGIDTRDGNGKLKDTVEIATQLSKVLSGMSESRATQEANVLGIDRNTMLAMRDPQFLATLQEYQKTQKELGGDQDKAAESARQLQKELNKLYSTLGIATDGLTGSIANGLLPVVHALNGELEETTKWFSKLDPDMQQAIKTTAAWVGGLTAAAGALAGLRTAWKIVKGVATLGAGGAAAGGAEAGGAGAAGGATASRGILSRLFGGVGGKIFGGLGLMLHSEDLNQGENEFVMNQIRARQAKAAARAAPAPARGGVPAAPSSGSVRDRIKKAMAFFMGKGWTKEQASGLVANLTSESGLDPSVQGDNGSAYGLAQWHPKRQQQFAKLFGRNIQGSSFEDQLAFVHYELTQGMEQRAGDMLKKVRNATEAGQVVARYYERPADIPGEAMRRGGVAAQISQTTHINVHGATDPRGVAREVSNSQNVVNQQLVRNFKTTAR